jgi:hypothetical protein
MAQARSLLAGLSGTTSAFLAMAQTACMRSRFFTFRKASPTNSTAAFIRSPRTTNDRAGWHGKLSLINLRTSLNAHSRVSGA